EQQKRSQEAQAADEANGGAPAAGSQAAETAAAAAGKMPDVDFDELLRPRGLETRLGESLLKLIEQESGRTLSGVVVVTDGASNAGVDHLTANGAARQSKVRLLAAGVGSTRKQANLKIAGLQAPTDVHVGDPYEITGFLQGTGLAGRPMD